MIYRQIWCIPDIHGRLDLLELVLKKMVANGYLSTVDLLVFTGDLIDRGPNVKGVIDKVIQLYNQGNVIVLRGNHEDFAVDYYVKQLGSEAWSYNGMLATISSYPNRQMSQEHVKFIASRPYIAEVQGFFFSHAPVPREKARKGPSHRDPNDGIKGKPYTVNELTWTYFDAVAERKGNLFDKHEGPISQIEGSEEHLIGICGHIHRLEQKITTIRVFPKYRLLDCGAGCANFGVLAAHECISNTTVYADPKELP